MIRVLTAIIAIGCTALPLSHRSRYRREWTAELCCIEAESGSRAALRFAFSLLLTAPKTAATLWSNPGNPFREASVVVLTVFLPCAFFVGYGAVSRQPALLIAHIGLLAGVCLVAVGMCRNLGHPLQSMSARLGLILSIGGGMSVMALNQLGNVSNPILDGAFPAYPSSLVAMLGLALLLASGIWEPYRRQTIQAGLILIVGGTFVWTLVVMTNTVLATSWVERVFQLVSAPTLVATSYAAWKAFGRPETYGSEHAVADDGRRRLG